MYSANTARSVIRRRPGWAPPCLAARPPLLPGDPVVIGERCMIFNQVIIYEGVDVAPDCVVEDRVRIGFGCRIGARSRLLGAYLCVT